VIGPLTEHDAAEAERLVDAVLGSRRQARLGVVIDVIDRPGLGAWEGDRLVGLATYAVEGTATEIAAFGVDEAHRGRGHAGRLIEAVVAEVGGPGARGGPGVDHVWLVTTNDNLTALALYQRHGFRLAELHPGAVDRARVLKPSIPEVGPSGIPRHDEIVLERRLG
jgi:ribosomal protein S18 acetylase RimI-like enzyme